MKLEEKESLLAAARPLIDMAIVEDIGPGDATTEATLLADAVLRGRMVAKAMGVIAGLPVAEAVFHRIDPTIRFVPHVADGQEVVPGELIAEVTGPGRSLLAAERTALNLLQHLSGVATLTRQFVDAVACTPAGILDTRKTLPGYRVLDKYAVRMGGGINHRFSLYDMMLVKDNHVDAAGGVGAAVARARSTHPALPIEVEVRDLEELRQALSIVPPLDRIMLDNMSLETMRTAVTLTAGRVPLEASGNVTVERAGQIAATGVDYLSVGALTHSAPAFDVSMKIAPPQAATHDLAARAREVKSVLGDDLVILGHHYQRDDVIALADFRGDSLQLARQAAGTNARFIVFCGVHFMGEAAANLAQPGQVVILPDLSAGCYLADTATPEAVQAVWALLDEALGHAEAEIMPITYVNSSAALKAFCGRHGGTVCTSSNAAAALSWALEQRPRAFFFPDQHLGRNTARHLGLADREILRWDPDRPPSAAAIRAARIILWPGSCNVHQRFRPEHVTTMRREVPGVRVVVHPECPSQVVELADAAGSTSAIIDWVKHAPPGSRWAIGTESHLVARLQREHPDQTIRSLAGVPPFCRTMTQITLVRLVEVLEPLTRGEVVNQIVLDKETAREARLALERMLALG